MRWFGENGRDLARRARGVDDSPLVTEHEVKSVSQETTFARDVRDDKALFATLRELSAEVGRHLREAGIAGTTVRIKLRWPDFTTLTRQVTRPQPTDQDEEIYMTALTLLNKVRSKGKAVRLIGVGVSGLGAPLRQMELWGDGFGETAQTSGSAGRSAAEIWREVDTERKEVESGSDGDLYARIFHHSTRFE